MSPKPKLRTKNRPSPSPAGVTTDGESRSRAHPTADDDISAPNDLSSCMHSTNSASEACKMKLEVHIGKLTRQIEIRRSGSNQFAIVPNDGAQIDAIEVAPNTYSILVNGRAFEA